MYPESSDVEEYVKNENLLNGSINLIKVVRKRWMIVMDVDICRQYKDDDDADTFLSAGRPIWLNGFCS